ncbi:hypothetical protein BH10ACI1_BH10ACI1_21290 [soil metagenome]
MKQKEYPMDENYNQALAFLIEQIAERDEMLKQLKLLPPEARPEGLRLLNELSKAIEKGEQKLADEYKAFQNLRRLEEKRDNAFDELAEGMAGAYVHAKYRNPEMIEGLDKAIADMPPDEAEAFYERAARIEAGDLIRIITREGETREQAEEFLKNYRQIEEEKRHAEYEDLAERLAMVFIHLKYRHPDKLEELITSRAEIDYTPEEEKDFYDRVARLEAEDLIGLIAREGETREQTEEFLKNYLAEQNK